MTYLEKALYLAKDVHKNQVDKNGKKYILHPLRVANALSEPIDRIVALLHDVVEDSAPSKRDMVWKILLKEFPPEVAKSVGDLTHLNNESLKDYAKRIKKNPIALRVKKADIADNLDKKRLKCLDTVTRIRLEKKYKKMLDFLGDVGQ